MAGDRRDEALDALRAVGFAHLAAYGHFYNGGAEIVTATYDGRTIRMVVEGAGAAAPDPAPARPPPLLGELDRDILSFLLSAHPQRFTQSAIHAELDRRGRIHGLSTLKAHLPMLMRMGLLVNAFDHKGYGLTDAGREVAASVAATAGAKP